jgi:hypothetical protein
MRQRIAAAVAAIVATGASVIVAISLVAEQEQVTTKSVLEIVRSTRYALHNACSPTPPLCVPPIPDDVVCYPVGCDAQGERERDEILAALGVRLSALPAVIAWVPEHDAIDDDGAPLRVPGAWREYRVGDLPREQWGWRDDVPSDDRAMDLALWALSRSPPPFDASVDGGPVDRR